MSQNIVAALSAGKFKKLFVFAVAALMLSGCGQSSNENASKDAAVKRGSPRSGAADDKSWLEHGLSAV